MTSRKLLKLEVEQSSGQWREVKRIEGSTTQYISLQLRQLQSSSGGKRVRALDMDGRLVDMLG